MNKGMLWFDNDTKKDLAQKIAEAVQYYRTKYGQLPNLCMVNPSAIGEDVNFDGVMVKSYRPVLPGHLWIGIADASKCIEKASADLASAAYGTGEYVSGAASLFHGMAAQVPDITFHVTCPCCLSENIQEILRQHGICYCDDCKTRFYRSIPAPAAGVDRDGQGGPPASG